MLLLPSKSREKRSKGRTSQDEVKAVRQSGKDGGRRHRRQSTSSAGSGGTQNEAPAAVGTTFSRVGASDAKTTFENILHSVRSVDAEGLDRESVARMVQSIYQWLSVDENIQIELPVAAGSAEERRMWPHGATVDSRRRSNATKEGTPLLSLLDLDEEVGSIVTSSVVSSTLADDMSQVKRGRVLSPADITRSPRVDRGLRSGGRLPALRPVQPPVLRAGRPSLQAFSAPLKHREAPGARISLLSGAGPTPPPRVADSPGPAPAGVTIPEATNGGLRVGTVGRGGQRRGDENRVVFAEESSDEG